MRLIDADEVIKKMNERAEEEILDFRDCRNIIEFAPTVLEIVRCKDCKYGDYCGENMFICEFHGCQMADFYCADGKMYD